MSHRKAADIPPRLLRTSDASNYLGVSIRTLEKYRSYGGGPIYRKIGGTVVYRLVDLEDWAANGTRASTSDETAGYVRPARPLTPAEKRAL
jgi:hypothetical protein